MGKRGTFTELLKDVHVAVTCKGNISHTKFAAEVLRPRKLLQGFW